MASRKRKKTKATAASSTPVAVQDQAGQTPAMASGGKKKAAKKRANTAVANRRGPGRSKGSKNKVHAASKPNTKTAARKSNRSRRYTPAEKANILAVARSEGLTGAQVAKKFGVSTLSYYLWRKQSGTSKRGGAKPGRRAGVAGSGGATGGTIDIAELIRREVRSQIDRMLPQILESEVGSTLSAVGVRRPNLR